MTVRYADLAERDFVAIGTHIARDSVPTALRFQAELDAFIEGLADHPLRYRPRDEWGGEVRAARLGRYLVIFAVEPDGILVLRIANGRRDIPALLREVG